MRLARILRRTAFTFMMAFGLLGPVLTFATVLVLGFTVIDSVVGIVPRDDVGPVAAITVFALAVSLGHSACTGRSWPAS